MLLVFQPQPPLPHAKKILLKYCKLHDSARPDGGGNVTKRGREKTQPAYVVGGGKDEMKIALHLRQTRPDGNGYSIFKAQLLAC